MLDSFRKKIDSFLSTNSKSLDSVKLSESIPNYRLCFPDDNKMFFSEIDEYLEIIKK